MGEDTEIPKAPRWQRVAKLVSIILMSISFICYGLVGLMLHDESFSNQTLLCPTYATDRYDVKFPGVKRESLTIDSGNGTHLDAWLFVVPGAKKIAIVNHGNAGNLTGRGFVAQAFVQAKTNVLLYDYRGYGNSTGTATVRGLLADGRTAYDYVLKSLHYKPSDVIEFGESIGSAVAFNVAAESPCAALMLFAPLDSVPSAGRRTIPLLSIYPDFCFAVPLNNIDLMSKIKVPIFICHGRLDITLSPEGSQRLYDLAQQPKTLVYLPESSHSEMSTRDGEMFTKAIEKFVSTLK